MDDVVAMLALESADREVSGRDVLEVSNEQAVDECAGCRAEKRTLPSLKRNSCVLGDSGIDLRSPERSTSSGIFLCPSITDASAGKLFH
jgi:hypothetical protein